MYAISIYETTDRPSFDWRVVEFFCLPGLRKILQSPDCIFSKSNYGPTTRSVVPSMVRRYSSVTPYLVSSSIRYWNPHSLNYSAPLRSVDRLTAVNTSHDSKHGQNSLISSNAWVSHLRSSSMGRWSNDGTLIASASSFLCTFLFVTIILCLNIIPAK